MYPLILKRIDRNLLIIIFYNLKSVIICRKFIFDDSNFDHVSLALFSQRKLQGNTLNLFLLQSLQILHFWRIFFSESLIDLILKYIHINMLRLLFAL